MKPEIISFLERVWMVQPGGPYGCVAWKDGDMWRQRFPQRDDMERAYQHRGRDLYFCPNLLSEPQRTNECVKGGRWLYADLDETEPDELDIQPTLWWETSPGRYQAMWLLDKPLAAQSLSRLNQKLTYYVQADLNGWPLAKVLRIPGTVSTKWGKPFNIHLDFDGGASVSYQAGDIWEAVKDVPVPTATWEELKLDTDVLKDAERLKRKLPHDLRNLLRRRKAEDRSTFLWGLALDLRRSGLSEQEAASVMVASPIAVDKYGARVLQETARVVGKAFAQPVMAANGNGHKKKEAKDLRRFTWHSSQDIMRRNHRPPGWLADGIWSKDAHGLIAGEQKAYKSLIVQDLAVSVATGTPFLGHFDIPPENVGPVIYVQEENQEAMVRDRLEKLVISRQLHGSASVRGNMLQYKAPTDVPVTWIMNESFDLTDPEHLQEVADGAYQQGAKLIIFDPLYLMMPEKDENVSADITPILRNLLEIKKKVGVGILIVHHYKKQDRSKPFNAEDDRVSGTSTFGRWWESRILIEKGNDNGQVILHPRHRMAPPSDPFRVTFDMGEMGDPFYEVKVEDMKEQAADEYRELRDRVRAEPGITVSALARAVNAGPQAMRRKVEKSNDFYLEASRGSSPRVYLQGRR